jgi:hypothetical protein
MLGGIWIHHLEYTLQPQKELVSIVATDFDMTEDDPVGGDCGQQRITSNFIRVHSEL